MAPTDDALEVVCDAGPLIHVDELGCVDLLADFVALWVPDVVCQEVEAHRPTALTNPAIEVQRLKVATSTSPFFRSVVRTLSLDRGEEAALSCMEQRPDALLLTDDAAARIAAKSLGYRAHGTLGVLLRSIRRGQRERPTVIAILRSLPKVSTLHIRPSLLVEIIEQAERADG